MDPTNKARFNVNQTLDREPKPIESKSSLSEKLIESQRSVSEEHIKNKVDSNSTKNIKSELHNNKLDKNIGHEDHISDDPVKTGVSTSFTALGKPPLINPTPAKIQSRIASGKDSSQGTGSPTFAVASRTGKTPSSITQPADNKKTANSKIIFGAKEHAEFYKKLSPDAKNLAKKYGLTLIEAAAIHAYTRTDYYIPINNQFRKLPLANVNISDATALKNAGVDNIDLANLISALVIGMKKLPPAQLDNSYFPSLGRNVTMPPDELKLYEQDAEITMPTFLSTTTSANEMITNYWWDGKDHALFIHQRVDGNGRDISPFSEFNQEKEILFLPNTKFKVMFRGEPTKTKTGTSGSTTTLINDNDKDNNVTKILISIQEIPSNVHASSSVSQSSTKAQATTTADKNSVNSSKQNKATYFGLR